MSWYQLLDPNHIYTFLLLFVRLSTLFVFMPFYNHAAVSRNVKAAFAFYLTLLLYPMVPVSPEPYSAASFFAALFFEIALGLTAGLALNIVFAMLSYAGEQIAFVMGFSLASTMDPQSGVQSPLVSQFLTMTAMLVLLAFNGHHEMLLWMVKAVQAVPPGRYPLDQGVSSYLMGAMGHLFVMGFSIAFPIVALSLLADVIFGMLMKTMPQFNLLVVGFPIKIALSLAVWSVTLVAMMLLFKREFQSAMTVLFGWLGGTP
ncbi:MAG: flagellar type III secretion system protein FliR [Epsilonproteobacteria bacterium]|nr:flagellar type III secretion system protein FliR [Campylobacterota bacterium]